MPEPRFFSIPNPHLASKAPPPTCTLESNTLTTLTTLTTVTQQHDELAEMSDDSSANVVYTKGKPADDKPIDDKSSVVSVTRTSLSKY